jgi:hypothetical protein
VCFIIPPITSQQVENILGQLNPNKSTGVDKISARFERIAAPSSSIAKLIYYCICYGTFPDHWKVAKVTSLFKVGKANDPSSFRPISILPGLSKVIEKHVYDAIYAYLSEHDLIKFHSGRSGFRKNHSTETALMK